MTYKFLKLNSCVSSEKIKFDFSGVTTICLGLLTPNGFDKYEENINSVKREIFSYSPVIMTIKDDMDTIAVADLNGGDITNVNVTVGRYSSNMTDLEIKSGKAASIAECIVLNAKDTTTEGSMIEHWENNKSRICKIDLDHFVCPSCGRHVSRKHIHGAHVHKLGENTLYITPTCDTCNVTKTDRKFKVSVKDIVLAPINRK